MGKHRCLVIGLAGGIGSGKSTVADAFARLGATVVNADKIAHEVLASPEVKELIAREFGQDVVKGGQVLRQVLAARAFQEVQSVEKLNAIIHPAVIAETKRIIEAARGDAARGEGVCRAVVIDAPLIFEAGLDNICDKIVFVDASQETRLKRLTGLRGWKPDELARREKFQESLIYKRQRADYTVDNNGSLDQAACQVASIWKVVVGA
jgi:dephospho-CoA kinase